MPVVGDLKKLETAVFDQDLDRGRTGIDGIFYQLFQSMHGSNNNLPCGDLVYDIWVESLLFSLVLESSSRGTYALLTLILRGASGGRPASAADRLTPRVSVLSTSISSSIVSRTKRLDYVSRLCKRSSAMRQHAAFGLILKEMPTK